MSYAVSLKGLDRYTSNSEIVITAAQITDFDTEVSNNVDVAANTAARHDAVTVSDGTTINFTLVGQDITAETIDSAIDHDALLNFVANEHIDWTNATDNLLTTGSIEGDSIIISSTIDHAITDNSGELKITNSNNDKDVTINVKRNNTTEDFIKIVSAGKSANTIPTLQLGDPAITRTVDTVGILNIEGNLSITGVGVGASFTPTTSGGNFVSFYANPTNITSSTNNVAFWLAPIITGVAQQIEMFRLTPASHVAGLSDTITGFTTTGYTRQYFAFSANDASNVTIKGIVWGGAITALDTGFTLPTFNEEMIKLTGGLTRSLGTGGSFTQKGIVFAGFGTISGATGSDVIRAIEADGGLFSFKFDYGTNNKILFGAGEDAAIGYDGTDFIIDTALVGTGVIKFANSTNWTANGTNTVTISNVAPSGVGTATISKWFTVKDNNGVVYYIPAWT